MIADPVLATSLPGEINAATRSLHTALNRLITSRLPLALPPYADDPSQYTTGLLHFSHIFFTFESLWTDLISAPSEPPTSPLLSFLLVNPYDSPELFSSPPSPQLLHFFTYLRPKGLPRSARLKRDLESLTGLHPTDLSVLLAQYPGQEVQKFCAHIRKTVKHKPHVLVAYAWCFYMAIFSGGRWIRSQLVSSGDDFWNKTSCNDYVKEEADIPLPSACSLSLWNFDGNHDGEDLKREFKNRLAAAEDLFTPDERVDIIEEAKQIFTFSARLVQELDDKVGTDMEKLSQVDHAQRARAREKAEHAVSLEPNVARSAVMWFQRPEVTGAIFALGCLTCVALLSFDSVVVW